MSVLEVGDGYNRKYPLGINIPALVKWLASEPNRGTWAAVAKILRTRTRAVGDRYNRKYTLGTNTHALVKLLASEPDRRTQVAVAKILRARIRVCADAGSQWHGRKI